MNPHNDKNIIAGNSPDRHVGRLDLIERIYLHAISRSEPFGMRISARPSAGASEMLRQVYDRLFREQRFVVPFYFELRPEDDTARSAAARFVYEFLLQTVAFRRNEPELIAASPDVCELSDLAPAGDRGWAEPLCTGRFTEGRYNNENVFLRTSLAIPFRAAAAGRMQVFAMIDGLHNSTFLDGGSEFMSELAAVLRQAPFPFVLSARRRFEIPGIYLSSVEMPELEREDAARFAETLSADAGPYLSDEARDLIAVQFGRDPLLIRAMLDAARERDGKLEGFRDVEAVYAEELVRGRINDVMNNAFVRATEDLSVRRKLKDALYHSTGGHDRAFALDDLREQLGVSAAEFERITRVLETDEVIDVSGGMAAAGTDRILRDHLQARYRIDRKGETHATVISSIATEALKRAPRLMSDVYRREAAIDLRAILELMDLQEVPRALLDHTLFRDRYRGLNYDEFRSRLAEDMATIRLPQVLFAAPVTEFYPEFSRFAEPERAAAGTGFSDRAYRDEHETAWLAAEVESKLEAEIDVAREWYERLEAAAAACGFRNYRIWLVAPEGFTDEALAFITERGGIGSNRRQAEMLREHLLGGDRERRTEATEYEMVIPVGEDTELVAAHSVEEIARRYNFPAKAVNQIKTALVEACINAAEHGLSPDKRIHQKFAIDDEKIVITISNRGLRLTDRMPAREVEPTEGRRGWGLKLIRGLMDDVRIESVDDGTRITMTKYLIPERAAA